MTDHSRQGIWANDDTWKRAKAQAALEGRPLWQLINAAIELYLQEAALSTELQGGTTRAIAP